MNRNTLVVKLVVLIIALVLVTAVCLGVVFSSTGLLFHLGNTERAQAGETFAEKSFSADEVQKIELNILSYDVVIEKGSASDVRVAYSGSADDDKAPEISFSDGKIYVSQSSSVSFFNFFSFSTVSRKITVSVPENLAADYRINTKSGDISFNADAKELSLESVSGDIQAMGSALSSFGAKSTSGDMNLSVAASALVANTTSGEIVCTCFDAQTADLSSTSGNIRSRGAVGVMSAETVSGEIFAEADSKSTIYKFNSVSGKTTLSLDNVESYSVKFDAVSGDMNDSYNPGKAVKRSGSYSVGENPALQITSNSVSGGLSLSKW